MISKLQALSQLQDYKKNIFGIGSEVSTSYSSSENNNNIVEILPSKTAISIDGLASTGKGELSRRIHELGIAYVYSGLVWRAVTYIFEDLEANVEEIEKVVSKLGIKPGHTVSLSYNSIPLPYEELKNLRIDNALNKYNKLPKVRMAVDDLLSKLMMSYNQPFVVDLRGANPKYIKDVSDTGFKIIRILLFCEPEEKISRRVNEYSVRGKTFDSSKVAMDILQRDLNDIQAHSDPKFGGIVHPESHIIDTTLLSIEDVFRITLRCIKESVKN